MTWNENRKSFPDTLIYLSRKQEVIMTNTSNVSLSYNWDILEFENLHRPITAQRSFIKTALPFDRQKSVFTISPNSGSIKAGQSERFVVEFRPDDMRQLKGIGSKSCYVIITSFIFLDFQTYQSRRCLSNSKSVTGSSSDWVEFIWKGSITCNTFLATGRGIICRK